MSKECPVTGAHCHNSECHGEKCAFDNLPEQREHFSKRLYHYYEQNNSMLENFVHIIEDQLKVIDRLTKGEEHHPKPHRTKLVLSGLNYKHFTIKNSIVMAISLNANEFVTSTLGLVDHITQAPITGASFSNQTYTSDQPGIASVDATGKVTAVSAGTANISYTADVSYTGTDGQPKTETGKALVVAVTVTGTPQSTDLTVTFSAPQPVV